jgi:tRNA threonylcarbamoyladenosine biosynthesis protein TsaB
VTRVLALECSTTTCQVALLDDERLLAERGAPASQTSEALLPLVDALTRELGLSPADLDLLATSAGPGSFTGLRIGLATAKGLAFALGRPLVTVSSLAALALTAGQPGQLVMTVVDARRGDVYGALYRIDGPGRLEVLVPDQLTTPAALLQAAGVSDLSALGPGLVTAGDGVGLVTGLPPAVTRTPSGEAVGRLALEKWRQTGTDELVGAEPTYLRLAAPEDKARNT